MTATDATLAALPTDVTTPPSTRRPGTRRSGLLADGRRQAVAMTGQLLAGVVNLLVSAVLARLLIPGEYAAFVAFLAVYVLLHTVAASVTAAVTLDPTLSRRLGRRMLGAGLGLGALSAVATPWIAPALGLPAGNVLLLAASLPSAVLLALARGRLYARRDAIGTAATLATEPLGRVALGLALVPLAGQTGAAGAMVGAGYAALLVAVVLARRHARADADAPTPDPGPTAGQPVAVTLTFLLVAVVAAQDVIVANRLLPGTAAGLIAVVATVGGAAYFATATVPMMLMGRDGARRGSLGIALLVTTAVAVVGTAVAAVIPGSVYAAVLGEPYRGIGPLVLPYVAAMAALGLAKVMIAQLCVQGCGGRAGVLVGIAALVQLGLLLRVDRPADVVLATATACAVLLVGSAALLGQVTWRTARPAPTSNATSAAPTHALTDALPDARPGTTWAERVHARLRTDWPLVVALAVGLTLRLLVTRSIWLDEAISIQQAQMPLGQMIVALRENDVHPPLFGTVLWGAVHLFGSTAEWVVRLPSLIAGTAFVVVLYAMARDLYDRRTAVVAGFVAAIAPVAVWYAQEARMYAFWMLFATVAAWMQLRILRRNAEDGSGGGRTEWVLFTVTTVALIYLQWFAALPIVVQQLVFLVAAIRRRSGRLTGSWLVSAVVSLAAFAPLVPYLLAQVGSVVAAESGTATPGQTGASASEVAAATPDVYSLVANLVWAIWGYHADPTMVQLSALWPVLLLVCFVALGKANGRHGLVLALIGLVPAMALFAIGFERRQFFELRYFTSTVPILLLGLSRLTATWGRGPFTRLLLPVVMMATLSWGLVDQQVNKSNPRTYDFRGAVAWVTANGDADDVVLYAPGFLKDEMAYYPTGMTTLPAADFRPQATNAGLPPVPDDGRRIFVFGSFLDDPQASAQVGKTLADLTNSGRVEVDQHQVANVTVWEFRQPAPGGSR